MRKILRAAIVVVLVPPAAALAQDKFFDSAGVQIHYVEKGSGEPVVLIHAYSGSIETGWVQTGLLENLARDYHVIALDLRAHGKSGKPHDPAQYGAQVSQDVVRLLDHLKIARAHIIGYSFGAGVTAKLVVTNPERFLSAILGGAAGRRNWTEQNARAAEAEASELEHGLPYRSVILRTWPVDQPPPTEETLRERSREVVSRNDPLAHAAMLRAGAGLAVTDAQLAAVRVATLAIVGSADANVVSVKELKAAWPALNVVVIDGASHTGERGALRRPEFVQAVRKFLGAHPASATSSK